jgi:hypothetical protein
MLTRSTESPFLYASEQNLRDIPDISALPYGRRLDIPFLESCNSPCAEITELSSPPFQVWNKITQVPYLPSVCLPASRCLLRGRRPTQENQALLEV